MIHRGMVLLFLLLALQSQAFAHGGVVEEDDICVIKVNYLRAHFKIYQPRTSGHEQFCEDLPAAAESVFVMEFMHDALETMPIDFRIIRDITGKGRFARMEDVQAIEDLDAATVFYQSASTEPDVYSVVHTFESEGDFIGIVSARNPESGDVYAAVFPFEVGFTGWGVLATFHRITCLDPDSILCHERPPQTVVLTNIACHFGACCAAPADPGARACRGIHRYLHDTGWAAGDQSHAQLDSVRRIGHW